MIATTLMAMAGALAIAQTPQLFRGRPLLHAHNAYPEKGRWADRIDRALATGLTPIVIEQDIALRNGASVVSHDDELTGTEPTLQAYFFDRVRPLMERALVERRTDRWPLVVLHLDFKTNEREHHLAVLSLLQQHRAWLTTAPKSKDPAAIQPLRWGPLLALTESGENQERDFFTSQPDDQPIMIFGSVPNATMFRIPDPDRRSRELAAATPEALIPTRATNYRRWVNFTWGVIEQGGPAKAGDWTSSDRARLTAVVNRARSQGLGIRFYTLNGHPPEAHPQYTASYNFGSSDAVRARWRAAIDAGVDLIATDQYEELAELLKSR